MNVFLVRRRLRIGDQEVTIPVGLYRRVEEAQEAAQVIQKGQVSMLECFAVRINSEAEGENSGIRVGQFLADVGVLGFELEIQEIEVVGAMVELAGTMPSGAPVWRS